MARSSERQAIRDLRMSHSRIYPNMKGLGYRYRCHELLYPLGWVTEPSERGLSGQAPLVEAREIAYQLEFLGANGLSVLIANLS